MSSVKTNDIDLNEKFIQTFQLLENTNKNVFITGRAGTGKSTFLKYFRRETHKNIVVLAPTGVAALNVEGQTIHSFFFFKPDITPDSVGTIRLRKNKKQIFKQIDMIIIDEISMVRSDLLDSVDAFLQLHGKYEGLPFGGIQMVFIGDLYQLPPVVTQYERDIFKGIYASPYFFDAKSFPYLNMQTIELDQIYRQDEFEFVDILSAVRNRNITKAQLHKLNQRFKPDFVPSKGELYIYLTPTNALADDINRKKLSELKGDLFASDGTMTGEFEQRSLPTHVKLELKPGAQVMLLNNDPEGRWINGTIGELIAIDQDELMLTVKLEDKRIVTVTPFTWEMFRFSYNEEIGSLESETIGSFTQFPLKLAWAVTIHKSQGKTFSKVVLDMGQGSFSHGQTYVALSRCTRLDGLVLKKPILNQHILLDRRVVDFMDKQKSDV